MPRTRPQGPPPQQQPQYNATIVFHTPSGEVNFEWNAVDGAVTINGLLVHTTNDIAVLHTMAKGMAAARGATP